MSVGLDRVLSLMLGRGDSSDTLAPRLEDVEFEESSSEIFVTVGFLDMRCDAGGTECVT